MIPFRPFPNIVGAFFGRDARNLSQWGLRIKDLVLLKQVHGDRIFEVSQPVNSENLKGEQGDAIIASQAGVPIAIKTADCVPILLAHPEGVVAAVHSGWKGTAVGILSKTLDRLKNVYGLDLSLLKMAIGPAIGMENYEVGPEVAERFFPLREKGIVKDIGHGKFLLDLTGANLALALKEGLEKNQIQVHSHCTFEHPEEYYSYRKALQDGRKKATGRNYSWIMVAH